MKKQNDQRCEPLPIAVIGVGAMGRAHCRRIAEQQADSTLVAVVDAHLTKAKHYVPGGRVTVAYPGGSPDFPCGAP